MIKLDDKSKKILKISLISILFFFILYRFDKLTNSIHILTIILKPFIMGLAMAYIVNLPMKFFEEKVYSKIFKNKMKKLINPLSLLSSYVLIFILMFIILYMLVPQLVISIQNFVNQAPQFLETLGNRLQKYPIFLHISDRMKEYARSLDLKIFLNLASKYFKTGALSTFSTATNIVGYVFTLFTNIFLGFIFSVYLLLSKKKLRRQVVTFNYSMFKEHIADYFMHVARVANESFTNFIQGQLTDATILGVISFVGMLIFSLPYAPMISVLVGFTDLIPIFGPLFGTLIGAMFIFIVDPAKAAVFLILMIVVQQIQGNIIYPFVVGNKVGLPSMWTIVAITVGGALFGVIGMIVFVPITSVLYTLLSEYITKKISTKNIDVDKKNEEYIIDEINLQ